MRALVAILLGAGLLAGCAGGGSRAPACAPSTASATAEDAATGYRLGSSDQVQLTVFRQPEMSGQFALDGEGYLALPLVGEIKAGGLTSRELEDQIEERLRAEGYLVNPQVGVQVLTYRSFYILGEVNQPGSYEYRDGMTVINAIALAGGYSYRAAQDDVTIERGDCSMETRADTAVLPGDILQVPERFF
jgi:polysaccharide export outer membrane protein